MAHRDSKYHQSQELKVSFFRKCTLDTLSGNLFNTGYFSIVLVNSGTLNIQLNGMTKQLRAYELIVISAKAFCKVLSIRDKLQVFIVSFTSEFAFKNSIRKSHIGYFEFFITKFPPKIYLKNKEASLIINLFELLDNNRKSRYLFQREKLLFSFNLLVYEIAAMYFRYSRHTGVISHTKKEKLVIRFFKLLEANCRKQHQTAFYADALFVTRHHLGRTVKEVTGKTAKQFIEEAIVMEAKILLQNDNLTISEIIEELEFSDPSFFSKFFKRHTSMSPTEYRLGLNF